MSPHVADQYEVLRERRREVPSGYISPAPLYVGTGYLADESYRYFADTQRLEIRIPLQFVSAGSTKLKAPRPIVAHIFQDGDTVVAKNETLGVVAYGEDPSQALDDFQKHLIHYSAHYAALNEDQLTDDAVQLKRLYAEVLKKIAV